MANLETRPYWSETVRQIEPGDKVIGGANAPINLCLGDLADRTEWLKKELVVAIANIGKNNQTAQENFASITAELARKVKNHGALSSRNLNDLKGDANYGVWHQTANAAATAERNYPTTKAGTLYVLPSAYSEQQIYYPLDQNVFYKRHSLPDGTWSAWHTMCEVIDSPSSTSTTGAASANQVKRLNDRAANIERTLHNPISNKFLQLKDDGTLAYSNQKIYHEGNKPAFADIQNRPTGLAGYGITDAVSKTTSITAGNGLTGGGDLSANRAFALGTPSQITATSTNAVTATSHTHAIDQASLTSAGIVQLNSATNSAAENLAATPKAVKAAYDCATQAAHSGMIAYFARNAAPAGWLKANGAAVSRTTYASLFAAIGTTFGAGDGSTTFNLPDLRGEFVRGWDDGRGIDTGRAFGSAQADAFQGHARNLKRSQSDARMHGLNYYQNVEINNNQHSPAPAAINNGDTWLTHDYLPHLSYGTPRVAAETRPRNIALLACIKI